MDDGKSGSAGTGGSTAARRVAILLPDLRPGGAELLHVRLANEWLEQGVEVDFVVRNACGELRSQLSGRARVFDLRARRVRNALVPLVRYLRQESPDVLLAAMWPLTVVAPIAALISRFKGSVAVSEHSPLAIAYSGRGFFHRTLLRLSTGIGYRCSDIRIGVSSGVADDMAALSGVVRDRFVVVHNPAAKGRDDQRPLVEPVAMSRSGRPRLLSVGMLKPVKRHDLLLKAFAGLAADTNASLTILGEGACRSSLEQQVADLGLAGRVNLPGFQADTAPWYAHADLFVLSSDYEGFGNVLVEAMEQGLPIVSTDCPSGPSEVLCGGRFGYLSPVGDAEALEATMRLALAKPIVGAALADRAADFSLTSISQRYLELLFAQVGVKS